MCRDMRGMFALSIYIYICHDTRHKVDCYLQTVNILTCDHKLSYNVKPIVVKIQDIAIEIISWHYHKRSL